MLNTRTMSRLLGAAALLLAGSFGSSAAANDVDQVVSVATITAGPAADSGDTGGVEEDLFHVGGSCSALAYLTVDQLDATIKSAYSDDRHSFCYPEEPSECSDYSGLLQGMGHLSTGEDGYHCNLQVQL